jgi:hypothetical protein
LQPLDPRTLCSVVTSIDDDGSLLREWSLRLTGRAAVPASNRKAPIPEKQVHTMERRLAIPRGFRPVQAGMRAAGKGDVMLRNQRKGWIAALVVAALLLASAPASAAGPLQRDLESWIVRLAGWLGLPPSVTAVWTTDSANIDPLGQPKPTGTAGTDSSANIDPDGQPGASSDSSANIDPNG